MIRFLGSEKMNQETNIDENKVCRWIRSVKDTLKPLYIGPVYTMVYGRGSSETPVGKIRGKTKMEQNGFMKNEADEESSQKSESCRVKKYFEIF